MFKQSTMEADKSISVLIDDIDDIKFEFNDTKTFIIVDEEWMEDNEERIENSIQNIFDIVSIRLKNDPHELGRRNNCSTCKDITGLIGKPFGCACEEFTLTKSGDSPTIKQLTDLWDMCKKFVDEHKVSCSESVQQVDKTYLECPNFVSEVCGCVGFYGSIKE